MAGGYMQHKQGRRTGPVQYKSRAHPHVKGLAPDSHRCLRVHNTCNLSTSRLVRGRPLIVHTGKTHQKPCTAHGGAEQVEAWHGRYWPQFAPTPSHVTSTQPRKT